MSSGRRMVHEIAGRENVVELFAEITELQEEPDANALRAEQAAARPRFREREFPCSWHRESSGCRSRRRSILRGSRARRSASAMRGLTRSARSWIVNGTPPPPAASAAANSGTQSARKPNISSANQTWSGAYSLFRWSISAAMSAGACAAGTDCPRSASRTSCSETSSRVTRPC